MNLLRNIVVPAFGVLAALVFQGCSAESGGARGDMRTGYSRDVTPEDPNPRTIAPYFTPATSGAKAPDPNGFVQRWLLLEPITNGLRTNAVFSEPYVRNAFETEYFPHQYEVTPKDGDKVIVKDEELIWHALDSTTWNVKLFRFAYGLDKPFYGITFFVYTVVDCPRQIEGVRMAVGSNSASMWWLNGQEAVGLFGDRRMVMDDGASKRLTLKEGRNVIRGAVINGPGMSDFCLRFIDEDGEPVRDFTINLEIPQD